LGIDATLQDGEVARQVSCCGLKGVFLWVHLGCMVFGEGAHVAPESFIRHPGYVRVATEAVSDNFGSPWWGGGWPLFYDRGCMGVASDSTDHTPDPI